MRKKKGQAAISTLVVMVASLIGLVVLLSITGLYGNIFKKISNKSGCELEFFVSSVTKQGGKEIIEPNCEPHKITIHPDNLTSGKKRGEKVIAGLQKKLDYENTFFNQYSSRFEGNMEEWAIDEIIAKEMKYCWDITGRGQLDLFDQWWGLFKCTKDDDKSIPCSEDNYHEWLSTKNFLEETKNVLNNGWPSNWNFNKPPTFCVLCSRIKFDEYINKQKIDSLGMWMANNPVSAKGYGSNIPYAAYIQNDAFKGIWALNHHYSYDSEQAYAVIYARINVLKANEYMKWVVNSDIASIVDFGAPPETIQALKLVPYKEIKDHCTYLVG